MNRKNRKKKIGIEAFRSMGIAKVSVVGFYV